MTPQRWQQLRALYNAALDMPEADRAQWLESACPDAEVRAELISLLDAGAAEATLMDDSPIAVGSAPASAQDLVGHKLGEFRVLQQIGSGGMGAVYLAERADGDFDQQVAIKVVKPGLASEQGLRRFLRERQILGRLNHRHICKILGGGVSADGRPYLVMPFLEGALPLDEYAARRDLNLRERLQLFLGVCEAVQHAHQNLVVHSDLKPANILVDDDGVVQLVDFGIARLLDAGARGQTTLIEGQRPLTPQFASPEQIEGQSPSTLSDVYSLGVVLYGLITDNAPYEFADAGLSEIAAKLATTDPLPPSRHRTAVPTDLDNVVLKAMAREPERRYLSAGALGEDLRRWLAGEPVQARAATLGYQFGKFVRRHRWPVATAALALMALVGVALVLLVSNRQISAQAELLQAEKERAEATALFWSDLFEQTDPVRAHQATLSTTELLDRAVAQLGEDQRLGRQTRARLLSVISTAYWNQGENSKAMDAARQAVALYSDEDPPTEAMAIAYKQLANIANELAELDVARKAAEKSIAVLDQLPDTNPAIRAHSLDALALVLSAQGELEAAAQAFEEALTLQAQVVEPGIDIDRATAMGNLGYTYFRMSAAGGPKAESYEARAAELVDQASQLLLAELGPDHPRVSFMLNAAGVLSRSRGDYDQAQIYFAQASEIADRGLPPEHDFHYTLRYNQGQVMLLQGKAEQALTLFADNYAKAAALQPLGHPDRLSLAQGLGQSAAALGETDLLRQVLTSMGEELQATEAANPVMLQWVEAFELKLQGTAADGDRLAKLEQSVQDSGERALIAFVAEMGTGAARE